MDGIEWNMDAKINEQVKNKIIVLGQACGLDFRVDIVFREDGGGACQRRCHGARE